jgi:hypothetical protein
MKFEVSFMSTQVSVPLDAALLGFVERAAERESRTVARQIRHYVVEAMRHADNMTTGLDTWPPPLAAVSRNNLSEIIFAGARATQTSYPLRVIFDVSGGAGIFRSTPMTGNIDPGASVSGHSSP